MANFSNLHKNLFMLVNKDIPKLMGQTNFVAKHIDEISVNVSQGALMSDLDATAYSLNNMYGGDSFGNIFKEYGDMKGIQFAMTPEEYKIAIDINKIESLNELHGDNSVGAGQAIVSYIANKLVNRIGLIRERNLSKVVTDSALYTSANSADLTTKKVSEWTEADIDNFFAVFSDLVKYLNVACGGGLFNDQMEVSAESGQKLLIVVPQHIYTKLMGIFRHFSSYITALGTDAGQRYKALRPDLFNAIVGGQTVVGTAFRAKDTAEGDSEYKISNMTDIWTENSIYVFSTSANMTDLASVKELVRLPYDIISADFMGSNYWRARTKRQTIANNPYGFAKINLKIN